MPVIWVQSPNDSSPPTHNIDIEETLRYISAHFVDVPLPFYSVEDVLLAYDVVLVVSEPSMLLYADDLKMYSAIRNGSDCLKLQYSVSLFQSWCSANMFTINASKCNVISFSHSKNPFKTQLQTYGRHTSPFRVSIRFRCSFRL